MSSKPTVFTHVSPYRAWIDKNLIDNQVQTVCSYEPRLKSNVI